MPRSPTIAVRRWRWWPRGDRPIPRPIGSSARRGWTIVFVPARPTGRTWTIRVGPALTTLASTAGLIGLLGVGVAMTSGRAERLVTAERLVESERTVRVLSDSVRLLEAITDSVIDAADHAPVVRQSGMALPLRPRLRLMPRPVRERPSAAVPAAGVVLPVVGEITSLFTHRRLHPVLRIFRPHKGVDVSAPRGTPILAPAAGRVQFVGRKIGDGLTVVLDHGGGITSLYAHCSSILVNEGDYVEAGTRLATVGSTGLATGPHLHFEVHVNGIAVDPLRRPLPSLAAPGGGPLPADAEAARGMTAPAVAAPGATQSSPASPTDAVPTPSASAPGGPVGAASPGGSR